jgi:hypothetical protein
MRILTGKRNFPPTLGFNPMNRLPALRTIESGVSQMKSNSRISVFRTSWVSVVLLLLALPLPALAALGGDVASVHEDQAQMKGSLKSTQATGYTVHEIKASAGAVVKEYISPAGKVFAITWHGPFVPNMQQLLGSYYQQFADAAAAQREAHTRRRTLNIQQSDLVVQNGGHMRSYFGKAYVPTLLPQGVSADEIQ